MPDVKRVIVGVSESPAGLAALRHAVAEARRADCVLIPVLAWTTPGGETAYYQYPVPSALREWQMLARKRLDTAFEEAFGGFPTDLVIRPIVPRAPAGTALVEIAGAPGDLLVVGAGRRHWARRLVRSSVTRYSLAHAKCPVVAVPPPELLGEVSFKARTLRRFRGRVTSDWTAAMHDPHS
ncbi:universal stress protein [Streptomyces kronopolitis]|uniref:universal stress protein n=1 Tax=Streptomyces kronopolitis TaxID=1612435 RepID=UPI00369E588D